MTGAILAAMAACVLLGVAVVSVRDFVLGRRVLEARGQHRAGDLLLPVTVPAGASPPVVRVLAAAAAEGPIRVHWCVLPGDSSTADRVDTVGRQLPRADLRVFRAEPDERLVARTALPIQALADAGGGAVAVLDESVRPSSRDPGTVLAAVGGLALAGPVGMCPAPSSGMEAGEVLAARGMCDHAPMLFAIHGPAGLWPLLVAASRGVWDRAATAPLAGYRPSAAAMLAVVASRRQSRLVPVGVGLAPGTVRRHRRRHFQWLVRYQRARSLLSAVCLAALPGALLAVWAAPAGPSRGVALAALGGAVAGRALLTGTWTREVLGNRAALQALVLAPWRDLRTLASLALAGLDSRAPMEGASFRMARGGVLTPVPPAETDFTKRRR